MLFTIPGAAQALDGKGWLQSGAVGLWVLVISILAMRARLWPRPLLIVGIAVAIAYFLVLATNLIPSFSGAILIIAGVGGIGLGPIWYIWLGIILFRGQAVPTMAKTGQAAAG
jgi:hypothetical protein